MKRITPALGATILAFGLASVSFAQGESDLRQEIENLKQGQQEIQKQLQEIQQLLKTRPAAPPPGRPAGPDVKGKVFDLADNPVKGESTAKLTLVDFTDYQ